VNVLAKYFVGVLLAVTGTASAQARVLALASNTNSFAVTATERPVPLAQDGAKALNFTTTRNNALVVVTYNAECAATGPIGSWVTIRILVDGVEADPRPGPYNTQLCSPADNSVVVSTAVTRQTVIRVPNAGKHKVQIFARLIDATTGRLDDSSIVIKD
jgi:hypothetical protein